MFIERLLLLNMGYRCNPGRAVNTANLGDNVMIYVDQDAEGIYPGCWYIQHGYQDAQYSTNSGTIEYNHSCAHSTWTANTRTIRIVMDNTLRNAVNARINSGGLVNLQNYIGNIPEFAGRDMNGNRAYQVYGYICRNRSISGSFDAVSNGYWEGNWPYNFPCVTTYSYDIPGVGNVSDTIVAITQGWYSRGSTRNFTGLHPGALNHYTFDQLSAPGTWQSYNGTWSPLNPYGNATDYSGTFGYYTIHGIYSMNTGSRGCYSDNAADMLLDSDSSMFGGIDLNDLRNVVGAPNKRMYKGSLPSITNNIIMAITNIDFQNNYIEVKFAFSHVRDKSMVAFTTGHSMNFNAFRISYNFPITRITQISDSWGISFINKSDFNPTLPNGNGASTVIWDSTNNAIALTAGSFVNNANGFSKIISSHGGVLQCSCSNVNNTIRINIGGYSLTIPSGTTTFDVRILCVNNGQTGYWRINPPAIGFTHSFTINYTATENAPIVSFENELYTATVQALSNFNTPFIFELKVINDEYTINVTGLVKCDRVVRDSKTYYAVSVYDVNGDFSSLMVKNGMYVTAPVTITLSLEIVNNTILIKAGIGSIGYTSTSIGDVPVSIDAVAVMLPTVASISKNGTRIGYATTTVNQNSFAFSFSALKSEVEQTDDFVSHYLQ